MRLNDMRVSVVVGCLFAAALITSRCGQKKEAAALPVQAAATQAPIAASELKTMTSSSGVEMVLAPAGEFEMGDAKGDDDEKPAHKVRLDAFWIDRHEVTQASYKAMAGKNQSKFVGENNPADSVSWVDAVRYCNLRSRREGLKPCYDEKSLKCDFAAEGYRLPTEAEWEYACRAGTRTKYSFGDDASGLAGHGWFKDQSGQTTHPVEGKAANAWGLFDMCGNVAEWCNDFYAEDAYSSGEAANPKGQAEGEECVLRGGSWSTPASACRSSARGTAAPRFADVCLGAPNYGFRCVRRAQ